MSDPLLFIIFDLLEDNYMQNTQNKPFQTFLERTGQRIPLTLFNQFVAVAKMFSRLKLEVRAEFYFNHDTGKFNLYFPQQRVHRYWVENDEPDGTFVNYMLDENDQFCELVCEIHAHHEMAPFPSSTDNASERLPGMSYVIVGHLLKDIPAVTARTFLPTEMHTDLEFSDIFYADKGYVTHDYDQLPSIKAKWFEIVR